MRKDLELEEILDTIHMLINASEETKEEERQEEISVKYSREELEKQGFGEAQIDEIRKGLEQKLPVWKYAAECYNWKQMSEIRKGLADGLDISSYENPLFSSEQMSEIRKGLVDKLEVSAYAHLMLSAKDMQVVRKNLLSDAYKEHPTGYARVVSDEESGVSIRISDDCMEAFVTLPKEGSFSVPVLRRILKRNDIVSGISEKQLKKAIEEKGSEKEISVAKGTPASTGTDGRYEFFFSSLFSEKPKVNSDGSVDYTQAVVAEKCEAGTPLAQYYPAEKGKDGETVTGILIKGIHGKDKKILKGQGFLRDERENLYRARISGCVVANEKEGVLNVWNVLFINGDINRYNGNVSYDGIIHIKGQVSNMARIEATGSVVVDGYVEGAYIKSGENIMLRSGMNGGGKGTLEAKGSVAGNFFEGVSIYAGGNVEGNYFLNCNVVTDKSLIARGNRSRIMGGTIRAGYFVETCSVIKSGRTVIEAGSPVWIEERLKKTDEMLSKTSEERQKLAEGKEKLQMFFDEKTEEKNNLFHKVCIALDRKEEEEKLLRSEKEDLEHMIRRSKSAYIKIYCKVQEGVFLSVCGKSRWVEKDISGVSMFRTGGV